VLDSNYPEDLLRGGGVMFGIIRKDDGGIQFGPYVEGKMLRDELITHRYATSTHSGQSNAASKPLQNRLKRSSASVNK
jgi:hypothetical protein